MENIYIGADHKGFELKNYLVSFLKERGINIIDLGPQTYNSEDDYPIIARAVSMNIIRQKASKGIVICGSGVGVSICCNKIKGIYCSLSLSPKHIISAVEDDDVNILALGADYISLSEGLEIVQSFLTAKPKSDEKYLRRKKMIEEIENSC